MTACFSGLVAADGTRIVMGGKPCLPGPLYQAVSSIIPILHGAIAVGIAEGPSSACEHRLEAIARHRAGTGF
jgi:hypothetical protein